MVIFHLTFFGIFFLYWLFIFFFNSFFGRIINSFTLFLDHTKAWGSGSLIIYAFTITAYDFLEADPQRGPLLKLAHSLDEFFENFLRWVESVKFWEHFGKIVC